MTSKLAFSYCLLQYKHNPWLKEKVNIGVLMFCPTISFLRLKVRGWDGRITAAYPDINKSAFTEDLKQIERAIRRFSRRSLVGGDLFSNALRSDILDTRHNHALALAMLVAAGRDSSYTWTEGGVGVCRNPEKRLESIFQRFVLAYDKEKSTTSRSDEQVWSEISRMIVARNLAEKIQAEPRVQTELGPIRFQAGYQNGAFHAIQSLSFDLADADRISAKAGKWGGFAHAVRSPKVRRNVVAQFVLGRPTDDKLVKPYKAARHFLQNVAGADNVFEEVNGEQFVNKIERDIRTH